MSTVNASSIEMVRLNGQNNNTTTEIRPKERRETVILVIIRIAFTQKVKVAVPITQNDMYQLRRPLGLLVFVNQVLQLKNSSSKYVGVTRHKKKKYCKTLSSFFFNLIVLRLRSYLG